MALISTAAGGRIGVLVLALACASAPDEYGESGARQSPHCDSVAVQSAATPESMVDTPPRPILLPLPPPPPASVRGRTVNVQFVVDPAGRARRVSIDGITDGAYLTELERQMLRTRFIPGTRGECRVYSLAVLSVRL